MPNVSLISLDAFSVKSYRLQSFSLYCPPNMTFQMDLELVTRASLVFAILSAIYYFFLIPRAIHGIPLGKLSNVHPLGDIPALVRHSNKCGSVFNFVTTRCSAYGSPIIQLLLGGSTFVVVGDLRETYDVALRRTKEFGHATRQDKTFRMIAKNATISMPSHAGFWAQRKIWSGIMSTSFLHEVSCSRCCCCSSHCNRHAKVCGNRSRLPTFMAYLTISFACGAENPRWVLNAMPSTVSATSRIC